MKSFIKYNLYLAVLLFTGFSHAATLEFGCITNNSGNCGSITSLFSLDVTDEGDGNTLFKFTLADGDNAAIMEIFFDDEQLGLLNPLSATLDENGGTDLGGGVDFGDIEVPGDNLPAGNTVQFYSSFSTAAVAPSGDNQNGIDNGEWLGINFYNTDFSAILAAISTGDLVIGLHVGSVGENYDFSESLTVVPVPAAIWLFGTAMIGMVGFGKRRKSI